MALVNFIKSIEKVTASSMSGATAQVALTQATDIADCIPFVSTRSDNSPTIMGSILCDAYFSESGGTNYINLERVDTTGTLDHVIYVVEFDTTYVNVYQGTCSITSTNTFSNTTITSIDTTKAFALVWAKHAGVTQYFNREIFRWKFTSATNLEMRIGEADANDITGHYYIVEAKNDEFTVDHQEASANGSGAMTQYIAGDYKPGRTLVIASHYHESSAGYRSYPSIASGYFKTHLPQLITEHKYYHYSTSYYEYVAAQLITFKEDTVLVYSTPTTLGTADTTFSGAMYPISNFDEDYCVPIWPGAFSISGLDTNTANNFDAMFSTIELYDTGVTVTRGDTASAESSNTAQVVVFDISSHGLLGAPSTKAQDGLIRSIEHVEGIMYDGQTQNIQKLTKGQDIENCILLPTWYCPGSDDTLNAVKPMFYLTTGPSIYTARWNDTDDINFSAYVVEFNPNKVRVESGEFYMPAGTTTLDIDLSTIVRDNKTFVVGSDTTSASNNYGYNSVTATKWITTSGIQPYRYNNNGLIAGAYYVVQAIDDDFTVHYEEGEVASGAYLASGNLGGHEQEFPVEISRLLQFQEYVVNTSSYHYRIFLQCFTQEDGSWICRRPSNTGAIYYVAYQVLLHERYKKYVKSMQILNNSDSAQGQSQFTINLPEYYDPSRSIVYNPAKHNTSYLNTTGYLRDSFYKWRLQPDGLTVSGTSVSNVSVTEYYSARITQLPPPYTHYFEGYTKELGSPVSRTVRAYRADTGEITNETTSSPSTGYFYLETTWSGVHEVICLDDEAGVSYNDLIYGKMTPTPINSYV